MAYKELLHPVDEANRKSQGETDKFKRMLRQHLPEVFRELISTGKIRLSQKATRAF